MLLSSVYAITNPQLLPGDSLLRGVEQALQAGLRLVQFRDKTAATNEARSQATALLQLCRSYGAQLIINDRIDLAADIGADGVHLGRGDGSIELARKILGPKAIIGATCHDNLTWAQTAIDAGADYVAFGRFYSSTTKPEATTTNIELLRSAKQQFKQPIVAIGGITSDNAATLLAHGADVIAVCAGIFAQADIAQATERMIKTANAALAARSTHSY